MSDFTIQCNQVKRAAAAVSTGAQRVSSFQNRINAVQNELRRSSSLAGVCAPLGVIQQATVNQGRYMRGMSTALYSCVREYESAEQKINGVRVPSVSQVIIDSAAGVVSPAPDADTGWKPHWDKVNWWSWKDTWNIPKQFGIVGKTIGTIGGLITGGFNPKNILSTAKDAASVVEKTAKAFSGSSFDWKKLFGFEAAITSDTPKNFFKAFGEEAGKYNFGNATKVGEKIAVGAKWAGGILTVVTTGWDNFTDKSNSTGRAVAETIGESAVKIGGGMVISAGVTAGAAALGFVGAPAVAVGLVTVGVTWGINRVSETLTGKGAAELISDTVIDTGIGIAKGVKKGVTYAGKAITNAGKAIGNAASDAGKAISGWWNKTFSFAH